MPTKSRDRTGCAPRCLRALTAVVALYALVLQALLGGIATLPVAGAPGLLCAAAPDRTNKAPDGKPVPGAFHAACCTAAGHAPSAAPPPAAAGFVAWTAENAALPGWRGRTAQASRASPLRLAEARAPPLA
ncbi:hypothetical protein [Methylorubrum suomiense]|uniref:DUF2946 domain-containing protein n=2 Tax=Methylorubrum suomiense TaxID=144191 RepID=A0ABQ4UNS2_9HYPH|nr:MULTISPECIES: hypothetical protein [Methylobacteriaceae]GJE73830.1 hypothetical protein BGCPKDLD_0397 [Methylorubrum suomiense]